MHALGNKWIGCAIVVLAFAGVLPHLFFEAGRLRRKGLPARIDGRYEAVNKALASGERDVGYVSDVPADSPMGQQLRYQAQYALSPHLLIAGTNAKHVIVNVADPRGLEEIYRQNHLTPLLSATTGVVLASPMKPRSGGGK